MRSHADAMQRDGDNDYDYDCDNDNDYDNESDIDMAVIPYIEALSPSRNGKGK